MCISYLYCLVIATCCVFVAKDSCASVAYTFCTSLVCVLVGIKLRVLVYISQPIKEFEINLCVLVDNLCVLVCVVHVVYKIVKFFCFM
jgi:hypothetical protein